MNIYIAKLYNQRPFKLISINSKILFITLQFYFLPNQMWKKTGIEQIESSIYIRPLYNPYYIRVHLKRTFLNFYTAV